MRASLPGPAAATSPPPASGQPELETHMLSKLCDARAQAVLLVPNPKQLRMSLFPGLSIR